jgi:predicted metalloprotease
VVVACSNVDRVHVGSPGEQALTGSITDAPAVHVAGDRADHDYDAFLSRVILDIEDYWKVNFPAISHGEAYEPLQGGVWPMWPGVRNVPGCGSRSTSYHEVKDNAFYCQDGDFIAFDDDGLFPRLEHDFGRYTLATVLGHEWGHAIQARRGYSFPGVIAELQADCFGGAWMGHIRRGEATGLNLTDGDLRMAITGILEFRDAPGTSADDQGAHGSAFDRLGSFQDGLEGGAEACEQYASDPPAVLELPFNGLDDTSRNGNMSLSELTTAVTADLDRFWEETLAGSSTRFSALSATVRTYKDGGPYPACRGLGEKDFQQGVVYCPNPEFVAYEIGGTNARLHDTIGDFSVGVLFADRWAEALQHRLGLSTDGERAVLQRDCLTGVWTGDVVPRPIGDRSFEISPGDLDEAVKTYLLFTQEADESADEALARIGSFRDGVFSGLDSCGLG